MSRAPARYRQVLLTVMIIAMCRGYETVEAFKATMRTTLYRVWTTDIIGHSLKTQEVFAIRPLMAHTERSKTVIPAAG